MFVYNKKNTDLGIRIEKDLIHQLNLNNETIQPIIHKKSRSPKMNVKKISFWCVFNEWDFFFFSV